jgi:uncharacterized membrane protein YfcA
VSIHLSAVEYLVTLAVVTVGAAVQGTLGFGSNLLAVPVVALFEPAAVPAATTMLALPLATGMAVAERGHVDWHGVGWLMVGRIPGTVVGAAIVAVVAASTLSVLAGAAVLVAVALSLVTTTVVVSRATTVWAGLASGIMGTATSIGGPPLALLYQHHEGPVLRSTLAVTIGIGTVISLGGQALAGAVHGWQLVLALSLLPGVAAGLALGRMVSRRLDERWLRPAVLAFATGAALLAIGRGLT